VRPKRTLVHDAALARRVFLQHAVAVEEVVVALATQLVACRAVAIEGTAQGLRNAPAQGQRHRFGVGQQADVAQGPGVGTALGGESTGPVVGGRCGSARTQCQSSSGSGE
jgi:hypothetical protein